MRHTHARTHTHPHTQVHIETARPLTSRDYPPVIIVSVGFVHVVTDETNIYDLSNDKPTYLAHTGFGTVSSLCSAKVNWYLFFFENKQINSYSFPCVIGNENWVFAQTSRKS